MSRKGRRFELDLCRRLSLWWTDGESDDVFYHTHSSGARGTARSKRGRKTNNAHGDIMWTDPVGKPLLDLIVWECKEGYNRDTVHAILDHNPKKPTNDKWTDWFQQAVESHKAAGSHSWAVVAKRDSRSPVVFTPLGLFSELFNVKFWPKGLEPPILDLNVLLGERTLHVRGIPLDAFLKGDPAVIRALAKFHS